MRQSGRTTRMLEDARRLSREGRAVYVIAANGQHAATLRGELNDKSISVETVHTLGNFDWVTMSLRGAHPNCCVLVDHYAIESRFSLMLEMLKRYDVQPPKDVATE